MTFKFISACLLTVLFISLTVYFAFHAFPGDRVVEDTRLLMGTVVQIKVSVSRQDEKAAREAIRKAFYEIARVEGVFSVYKDDSEISRVNRLNARDRLTVSDETFRLIQKSVEYSNKTDGAFDITVKPLADLWASAKKSGKIPASEAIKKVLSRVGFRDIVLDQANTTISFNKEGMALDLGGVAKGYATDRAVKVLEELGVISAVVNSGGDMYCLGRKSADRLWKVGIQHPRDRTKIWAELKLENKAIDTSGDYEKYFVAGGRRYSHIIDPRSGYPVGDGVVSASVIADDSATADILATALCVLGEKGLSYIRSMNGIDAILIIKEKGALRSAASGGVRGKYGIVEKTAL